MPYDVASVPPRKRLAANFRDIAGSNALSADRVASLVQDSRDAGVLGMPRVSRSHGNHARALHNAYLRNNQWPKNYWAEIRARDLRSGAEVKEKVAFVLPHEQLACLV